VSAAWERGEVEWIDAWGILTWLAIGAGAVAALLGVTAIALIRRWARRSHRG
jgi:hypothetical protein